MGINIEMEVGKLGNSLHSHTVPVKALFGGRIIVWIAAYAFLQIQLPKELKTHHNLVQYRLMQKN
jgi:hypothetical protein